MELIILLIAAFIMGFIGYHIGKTKGRGSLGVVLGLILGPIGWIIVLLMPAVSKGDDALSPEFLARRAARQGRYGNKTPAQQAKEDAWRKAQEEA